MKWTDEQIADVERFVEQCRSEWEPRGFFRAALDLDCRNTAAFLESAEWRPRDGGGVEVMHDGKWKHLCRTDLKDDVRTWTSFAFGPDGKRPDVHHIDYYRSGLPYGARITDDAFFVVDAYSDG